MAPQISSDTIMKQVTAYLEEKGIEEYSLLEMSWHRLMGIGFKLESWDNPQKVMQKLVAPWLETYAKDIGFHVRVRIDTAEGWDPPVPEGCAHVTILFTDSELPEI